MIKGKIERIEIKGVIKGATLYTVNYDIVYTKEEVNDLLELKQDVLGFNAVPTTRTINNKALTSNITLNQDDIADGTTNKVFTSTEKTKLAGIETGANNYVHPSSHPSSMITTDSTKRFVSDVEKSTWNSKANGVHDHNNLYYTESEIDSKLALKQNTLDSTNLKTVNNQSLLGSGNITITADTANFYTKTETNTLLNDKSNISHIHDDRYYTETETNTLLSSKSDTAHNHNLNDLTEKSYNSLTDKPDLSSLHTHSNKTVLDNIVGNGDGSSFLANDGTYKTISGSSTDHSALSNRNIADQHTISSITGLQSALDGKQSTISLTADRVAISSGAGALTVSDITVTELNYLNDVSANIQTQLNGKSATSHIHDDRYYTEAEIDSKIGDIETLLAAL